MQNKWTLDTSNSEYRTIRAEKTILKHELIFETDALATAVFSKDRTHFCFYCLKESNSLSHCAKCSVLHYCSDECQKSDWISFHKHECAFLEKLSNVELSNELILALRIYLIYKQNETFQSSILKMKSHEKNYSSAVMEEIHNLSKRIIEFLGNDIKEIPTLIEVISKVKINFYTIEKPSYITNLAIGTGFYDGAANFFNHSCIPNAFKIFSGRKLRIYSSQEINPGEEIFICYDELLGKPFNHRSEYLQENYKMTCLCKLCKNERLTTVNIYPNISLRCMKCPEKAVIINNVCTKCNHHYSNEELGARNKEIEESIEKIIHPSVKDFNEILKFLEDLKKNKVEKTSYLLEQALSSIIKNFLTTFASTHTKELYGILKFYVRNYTKWFEIQIMSLGFKYNELSKLALTLKKGKKAKMFCEEAFKLITPYFVDTEDKELIELKKRMKTVDLLLDAANEIKKPENTGLLKID